MLLTPGKLPKRLAGIVDGALKHHDEKSTLVAGSS